MRIKKRLIALKPVTMLMRSHALAARVALAIAIILLIALPAAADAEDTRVTVCILDSGSNLEYAEGMNIIEDTPDISDGIGHGTRVHSLIAACAPDARVIMLKCFGDAHNFGGDAVVRALYAAIDIYSADIINMSWTLNEYSEELYKAVSYASGGGAVLIASAGNLGLGTGLGAKVYPAAWDDVIGVAGVNISADGSPQGSLWYLSGEAVFVCARADCDGEKGSSYAAARVSGVAAELMKSSPKPDARAIKDALRLLAIDIGAEGYDTKYGWGYIYTQK